MADARDDNTQLICTTEPNCLCAGESYSCDCEADDAGEQCAGCEAVMKRIDGDTGEDALGRHQRRRLLGRQPVGVGRLVSEDPAVSGDAQFYDGRRRRLWLYRPWGPNPDGNQCLLIGLNPSFADEEKSDHTITVEIEFCRRWGFDSFIKLNLFDWISTDPEKLAIIENPEGDPSNILEIGRRAGRAGKIVACWGDGGLLNHRASYVRAVLEEHRAKLFCLGLTKKGQPRHTSRLSYETQLVPMWRGL